MRCCMGFVGLESRSVRYDQVPFVNSAQAQLLTSNLGVSNASSIEFTRVRLILFNHLYRDRCILLARELRKMQMCTNVDNPQK